MNWYEYFKAPSVNEIFLTLGAFLFLSLAFKLEYWLKKWLNVPIKIGRNLSHLLISFIIALSPIVFRSAIPLILIAVFLFLFIYFFLKKHSIEEHPVPFTYYFPFIYLILIFLFWNIDQRIILLGLAQLIPVSLSSMVEQGSIKSDKYFVLITDRKSWYGVITNFILSITLTLTILKYFFKIDINLFFISLALSLILAAVEMLSVKGTKQFLVPLSGAILGYLLIHFNIDQLHQFLIGELLALITALLSYRFRFLSVSGSVMVFILATVIFGLGGFMWSIPILTFFIFSSLISKLGKNTKLKFKDTFEKTGVRDHIQVMANGGIGGILIILNTFYSESFWFHLYLLSLMVATADTWSTELGVLSKSHPRLITNFKIVEPGISGGISVFGTLGGFLGSVLVLLSGLIFIKAEPSLILLLLLMATFGNFVDSLIGATIQGQYQCQVCDKYTEKKIHCNKPTKIISGLKFIGNDTVNLSSNLITLVIYFVLTSF